jgi:hypothetical protein
MIILDPSQKEVREFLAQSKVEAIEECPFVIARVKGDVPEIGGYSLCYACQKLSKDGKVDYLGDTKKWNGPPGLFGMSVYKIHRCRDTGILIAHYDTVASHKEAMSVGVYVCPISVSDLEGMSEREELRSRARTDEKAKRDLVISELLPLDMKVDSLSEEFRDLGYQLVLEDKLALTNEQAEKVRESILCSD